MGTVLDILSFRNCPNAYRQVEAYNHTGAGANATLVTDTPPPMGATDDGVLKITQIKDKNHFEGDEYTPVSDEDIMAHGFFRAGNTWPLQGVLTIYPLNVVNANGAILRLGFTNTGGSSTKLFVHDANGAEVASANDIITAKDVWYYAQVRARVAASSSLEVRVGRVVDGRVVDLRTRFTASGCDFWNNSGNARLRLEGQGGAALLDDPTTMYFSDWLLIDDVDDESWWLPFGHRTYCWGSDLVSATPHYNKVGGLISLQDLTAGTWSLTGDSSAATVGDYAALEWGAVRIDGPKDIVTAPDSILGAAWWGRFSGTAGQTYVDFIYGKGTTAGASVTLVTTAVGRNGYHRVIQDAAAPSANRVPNLTEYGVVGFGNNVASGPTVARAHELRGIVAVQCGLPAGVADHRRRRVA